MNTSDHFTVGPDGETEPGGAPHGKAQPGGAQHGKAEPGGTSLGGFFGWIRSLRITRGDDRWFAGVASGIANRLNIDPLIVRGIFIVLAIVSAPALTLYLIGWIFLPDTHNRLHAEDVLRGRASSGVTVAVVLIAVWFCLRLLGPVFTGVGMFSFSGRWDLWSALGIPGWITGLMTAMFWVGLLVAAGFAVHYAIVHHGKKQQHTTEQAPDWSARVNNAATQWSDKTSEWSDKASEWGEKASEWGENVSQQAEAWSTKYAETHEARSASAATKMLIIGAAIMVGAAIALWVALDDFFPQVVGTTSVSTVLLAGTIATTVVLSIGMVVLGAAGKYSGSVGFFATVGTLLVVASAVIPWGASFHMFNNQTVVSPNATAEVTAFSNTTFDLQEMHHTRDEVELFQTFGSLEVIIPDGRPTTVNVQSLVGRVEIDTPHATQESAGIINNRVYTLNEDARGPALDVTVRSAIGNVTITHEGADR